jgi:hypothetical protein
MNSCEMEAKLLRTVLISGPGAEQAVRNALMKGSHSLCRLRISRAVFRAVKRNLHNPAVHLTHVFRSRIALNVHGRADVSVTHEPLLHTDRRSYRVNPHEIRMTVTKLIGLTLIHEVGHQLRTERGPTVRCQAGKSVLVCATTTACGIGKR